MIDTSSENRPPVEQQSDENTPTARLLRTAHSAWMPPAVLVLLTLLLFWPLVLGGRVLYWGTPLLQFYPWRSYAAALYRNGELPLWDPYLGMGFPLAANLQSAVFYPINLLLFFAVPAEVGLGLSVVVHVALAGLFTYAFVRAVGLSRWASLLSALCYMFSGYVIARAEFLSMTSAVPWLPLLLLSVEVMRRGITSQGCIGRRDAGTEGFDQGEAPAGGARAAIESGRAGSAPLAMLRPRHLLSGWLILVTGSMMLLLAGHAQLAFYTLLCAAGYAALRAAELARSNEWRGWGGLRQAGLLLICASTALLMSFASAAIQLVPTAELTQLSVRASGVERELALTYSLWPPQILGVLAPDAFGNPASDNYWGPGNYWEVAAYVGVLPLLLAVLAVWRVRAAPARGVAIFFACLAAASLLLATGKHLPLFVVAYERVPGFGSFQAPARLLFLYTVGVAFLAGVGLELLLRGGPQRAGAFGHRLALVGVGFLVAGSIGTVVAGPILGVRVTFVSALLKLGALLALSGLLVSLPLVRRRLARTERRAAILRSVVWPACLLSFVVADLFAHGVPLNPTTTPEVYRTGDLPTVRFLRDALGDHRLYTPEQAFLVAFHRLFSFKSFGPSDGASVAAAADLLPPNVALSARLPEAYNYDPLQLEDVHRLQERADTTFAPALLSVMAARYVLTDTLPVEADLPVVYDGASRVRESRGALPRAFVAYQIRAVAGHDAALAAIDATTFDPWLEVVLEGVSQPAGGAGRRASPAPIASAQPHRVVVRVDAEADGYLVLSDVDYPGWRADVDGQRVEILRANYAFRAVPVQAGRHEVEFRYQPASFVVGLIGSLAAVAALVLVGLVGGVRGARARRWPGASR